MTRYAVSGEVSPDCTIADTGEPAGEYNGQPYWTWEASGQTWYLSVQIALSPNIYHWVISTAVGDVPRGTPSWYMDGSTPIGDYVPNRDATGTATVAEYVPPDEYIVVEWTASGKFTILKKSA